VTYAQLGQMERAPVEAAEVLRVQPNYTTPGTARRLAELKDDKHCFDDLRKAGCLSRCMQRAKDGHFDANGLGYRALRVTGRTSSDP
jgi:hypothetical protein